jgi:CHASE3 domain sensor protein
MPEQPHKPSLASVEADLFGAIIGFHQKTMTLLRQSSLDDKKINVVGERIKTLLDNATAEMERTQQMNVTERLEAAYEEVKKARG